MDIAPKTMCKMVIYYPGHSFHIRNVMYKKAMDSQGNLPKWNHIIGTIQHYLYEALCLCPWRVMLYSERKFLLLSPCGPNEFQYIAFFHLPFCTPFSIRCAPFTGLESQSFSSTPQSVQNFRSLRAIHFSCLNNLVESVHSKMWASKHPFLEYFFKRNFINPVKDHSK